MIALDDIVAKAQTIYGAFLPAEIKTLAQTADSLGSGCNFVEIGSYFGRSSVVLGMIARKNNCHLTCIDIFNEFPPDEHDSDEIKKQFKANMKSVNAEYRLLNMLSEQAGKIYQKTIDLLFIDGDHSYDGVKSDIELWLPKVKVGGFVLFHDCGGIHPGVEKAVDEAKNLVQIKIVESLLIAIKEDEDDWYYKNY